MVLALGSCDPPKQVQVVVPEVIETELPNLDTNGLLIGYFDSLHLAGAFNGVALFYRTGFKSTIALGERRIGEGNALKSSDAFQLASLSKPFAALAVLWLAQNGQLELDAPVSKYLFDFDDDEITVRSLLNHTSGIGNYMYVTDSLWHQPDSLMRNDDVYDLVRCGYLPRYHPPFKRFSYCNTNYALIPVLVERITELSFSRFMHQTIFAPLGMDSTHWVSFESRRVGEYPVLGHYPNGDQKADFYLNSVLGDKSLYSSVEDLFKFYQAYLSGKIINREWMELAMKPEVSTGGGNFYGLGWRIKTTESGDTLIYHNGWWRGFRSYFWMAPSKDKVAIILTNSIKGGYLKQEKIWTLF